MFHTLSFEFDLLEGPEPLEHSIAFLTSFLFVIQLSRNHILKVFARNFGKIAHFLVNHNLPLERNR